jgi:hypothetical protein
MTLTQALSLREREFLQASDGLQDQALKMVSTPRSEKFLLPEGEG